ncbi:MAG TPA: hypothetical protein VGP47_07990 [Parachlamydiaceae bacterium]|nr:hypothetical protein [Parachlamydiaceae bacterium]
MSLTLATTVYQPQFYMPKIVNLDEEAQDYIREEADRFKVYGKYTKAAKLYFILIDNCVSMPYDSKKLNDMLFQQFDCSQRHQQFEKAGGEVVKSNLKAYNSLKKDYNFSEIQIITSSCEKAGFNFNADLNINNLIKLRCKSKTKDLSEIFERVVNNTLLLIKSNNDEGTNLAILPLDIRNYIAKQCLDLITEICHTPVDLNYDLTD